MYLSYFISLLMELYFFTNTNSWNMGFHFLNIPSYPDNILTIIILNCNEHWIDDRIHLYFQKYESELSTVRDCVEACNEKGLFDVKWNIVHFADSSLCNHSFIHSSVRSFVRSYVRSLVRSRSASTEAWGSKTFCCDQEGCNSAARMRIDLVIVASALFATLTGKFAYRE